MSMNRRKVLKGALAAGIATSALKVPAAVAQAGPIKVGFLTIKTGPLASGGLQMEQGLVTFFKERNNMLAGRPVQLFRSHREGISDGDQRRDFIYVDDVVRVMMWLLATPTISGLFNVGTGAARSFKDMMLAAYAALGAAPNIQYIDMPEQIRGSYQYFTQSEVDRLRGAGYNGGFTKLEDAVELYVKGFLDRADRFR